MQYSSQTCRIDRQTGFAKPAGFTLVELMIAVFISAILLTMAVPSFTTTIQNNRITSQVNDFVSTLNYARTEAIKRGARVAVCKSPDATNCNTSTTGWEQGWIIFIDSDSDNTRDSGETILSTYEGLPEGSTLTGDSASDVKNFVSYKPSGKTTFPENGGDVELILCDSRNDDSVTKAIAVAPTGRVSTMAATASSLSCGS